MEDKKPIKISLSMFIAILILLVAVIFGIYMLMQNQKLESQISKLQGEINNSQITKNELQEKLNNAQNTSNIENTSSNSTEISNKKEDEKKTYSFTEVKGSYVWKYKADYSQDGYDGKGITLFEDGIYATVENFVGADGGAYGNYTIDGNTIILNELFYHGSDIGISIQDRKQTKLKIEGDTLIMDSDKKFVKESDNGRTFDTINLNEILQDDQKAMEREGHFGL